MDAVYILQGGKFREFRIGLCENLIVGEDALVHNFYSNILLSDAQAIGRNGQLTTTAVARIVVRIYNAFEKEEPLGLTLLVLSKTFEVVSHGILHEKLKNVLTSLI